MTTTASPTPALQVHDLSIRFGGIKALTDVSFEVPAGGFTAVIGPNGAGKTTLFNCVSGFYRGTGSITLAGETLEPLSRAQRVRAGLARTFQTPTLLDDATVLENVALGRFTQTRHGMASSLTGTWGWRREERDTHETSRALIEHFGLSGVATREAGGLPHRERRLVEICRALAARPRLLMLDEPAAGTQHDEAVAMIGLVRDYCAAEGITVVLVEHNVRLVMQFALDIVVLNFGSLLARGAPDQIRQDASVIQAYLGDAA